MAFRRLTWVLLGLYALYYVTLCFILPVPWIVNGLLDDSFYYLQVARNVARGLGSTFDGVELTNGYHPLWMLLNVPLQAIAGSRAETGLALSLGLSVALGLATLFLLRRILIKECDGWTAAVGMLLFAWPRFFGQTINLLETGLLLSLFLLAISIARSEGKASGGRKLAVGLVLGLAALARLDTVFLLIAAGFFALFRAARGEALIGEGEDDPRRGFLRLAWSNLWPLGLTAALIVPYLFWNWTTFGHLQPVSGAIKSTFPDPRPHLEYLRQFPEFTLLLLIGAGFFVASLRSAASRSGESGPSPSRLVRVLGLFGLAGLLHMAYTILFMGWGVDRWHFAILIPIGLLGIPWMILRVFSASALGRRRFMLWAVLVVGLIGAVGVQTRSFRARRERHLAASREVALWARAYLPPEAVFGMADAGVFAFFSDRTTVNLDGLINNFRYQEALRSGRVLEYLRARGIEYIFDQYVVGHPEWISGRYDSRVFRFWYRRENRLAGQITLRHEDEVHRVNLMARWTGERTLEPGALILYRYWPEGQR
jgi:hypothetical protein